MSYSFQNQNNHYLRKQGSNSYNNNNINNKYLANDNHRSVQSRYGDDARMNHSNISNKNTPQNDVGTTLYMGDLDFHWDEKIIKSIWNGMGMNNVNVKMVWQSPSNNALNQGYCFIEFPTHQEASQALLNNNGLMIPGYPNRHFKLNWSDKGKDNSQRKIESVSIFVGDLASTVTETQLYDLFVHRYKSTLRAKIMIDLNTGLSKGYGFIKFTNPIDQQNALLEMQGVILNGRAIKLGPSNKSNSANQEQTSGDKTSSTAGATRKPFNNVALPKSQFMPAMQYPPTMNHFTDPNNTTVFIGGLSPHVTEEELRVVFEPFGSIVYVNIPLGKGCGFIQFVERSAGESAIANMQGFPIGNSRIRLSWGRSAKQYSHGSSLSPKNYVGQLAISSPIYSHPSYIATTASDAPLANKSVEYLPGFQDNYFNASDPSTSFERLEMRSNMYM